MSPARPRPRKSLPLSDWPKPDRLAWLAALNPGQDVFDDVGPAAHWAASTRAGVQYDYGRWLGFVAACEPDALALAPDARADRARIARFLAHLSETLSSTSQYITIHHFCDALAVMIPDHDCAALNRVVARLARERQPRDKRPRLVTTGQLLALGYALMDRVPPGVALGAKDLRAYRDGLMIALLAARPLRLRNFAAIELKRHLIAVGTGFHLAFEAGETKTGQPIEIEIPADLTPRLACYLSEIRPCFPNAAAHRALWAGFKGRGLRGKAVYEVIVARTQAAFGRPLSPHLFRHCAATTIAIVRPGQVGVARDLLGHASLATTNAYYNQARSIEASRLHADVLAACRSAGKNLADE